MIQFEEKKTTGNLVAFIDLLFLMICFFVFLLNQTGKKSEVREMFIESVQEQLIKTREKYQSAKKKIEYLQPLAETALQTVEEKKLAEAKRLAKFRRFQMRPVEILTCHITKVGTIIYQDKEMTTQQFFDEVVSPLRETSWIAFRAYAEPQVPFGMIIEVRKNILKNKGEFDTFWSNLGKQPEK